MPVNTPRLSRARRPHAIIAITLAAGAFVSSLAAAQVCADWHSLPRGDALNGFDSNVRALALMPDVVADRGIAGGTLAPGLYAGGFFTSAQGQPASFIAHFNGNNWSTLGTGLSSRVWALAIHDDAATDGVSLYAGGDFTSAGGVAASRIARWDGSSWSSLGSGVNNSIRVLASLDIGDGTLLYAGGRFTQAGGQNANFIAAWDGTAWSPLGTGMNDQVRALATFDDGFGAAVYAAGEFTTAGGNPANRIARWDGKAWTNLAGGLNDWVFALAGHNDGTGDALYAGGNFTTADGQPASRVARWDGFEWTAVGSGMNDWVYALTVFDDGTGPALYAAGEFTVADGFPASRIAKWNGLFWQPVGTGTDNWIYALAAESAIIPSLGSARPNLYAGGNFTVADDTPAARIAAWTVRAFCAADLNGDCVLDFLDLTIFTTALAAQDISADWNDDGLIDYFDVVAFVGEYHAGCP